MAKKKKSWFNLMKRLFIWDTQSKQEKKEKRRKWIFGRLKMKRMPSITSPPPLKEAKTTVTSGEEEEQSKHALTMAIASAEAVVAAAAQAAAEVVRIAGIPESSNQCEEKYEESDAVTARNDDALEYTYQCLMEARESAAIKIQTAFRGFLARKALRALKGIVKLQAIIRGRAVRRQAVSTLKYLQSIVSIQSQVCARRLQMAESRLDFDEKEETQSSKDKIIRFKMDSNSERRWDDSILLKEESDASYISKKEALLKREKIKEYSFNHRRSAETERDKVAGRWRYWLEQWVDTQLSKSKELEDLDSLFCSNSRAGEEYGGRQIKLRNIPRQNQTDGLNSPNITPRRHFPHKRQSSLGEEHTLPRSPVMPTYMAATESARAKARSTSYPKLRSGNLDISNSDSNSPCKKKISLVSTVNSEGYSNVRMSKLSNNQQRSPSFKGISVPVKSSRMFKDLSINSDSSLPSWDRQCSFK